MLSIIKTDANIYFFSYGFLGLELLKHWCWKINRIENICHDNESKNVIGFHCIQFFLSSAERAHQDSNRLQ